MVIPAKTKNKKDCQVRDISQHIARFQRLGGFHEAVGAVRRSHVLTLLKMLSKLKLGTKKIELTYSVVPPPECNIARTKLESLARPRSGVRNYPNFFSLKQIPLGWEEHIFHTGSSANYRSILEEGPWAGGLSL